MNNFKKLALGLVVGALAIGGSAFTNVEKKSITESFLVQSSTGNYDPLLSTPNPDACTGSTQLYCFYNVTSAGKANIPALLPGQHYTVTQINDWLTRVPAYITVNPLARKAEYIP